MGNALAPMDVEPPMDVSYVLRDHWRRTPLASNGCVLCATSLPLEIKCV